MIPDSPGRRTRRGSRGWWPNGWWRWWPLRRFVVADRSMEPTLVAGEGLVGWRTRRVSVDELRCVEHPGEPGFWLVKRVADHDDTTMTVVSDNRSVATVDSRRFGPVPIAGSYRVIARVPTRWM